MSHYMPVEPFRHPKDGEDQRPKPEGKNPEKRRAGSLVRLRAALAILWVFNYVGGIHPTVLIDVQRAVFSKGTYLIEARGLVVPRRLIKIGVGEPEQREQDQFYPASFNNLFEMGGRHRQLVVASFCLALKPSG